MVAAGDRRGSASGAAAVWTRAVVIALIAAIAVLVHHEAPDVASHVPVAGAMQAMGADMKHDRSASPSAPLLRHAPVPHAAATVASGGDGACSGMAGQHCSTASVETVKLTPPADAVLGHTTPSSATTPPAGRALPGTVGRAPPDLSVLSRLLV
jgi:hypothetical protein